MVYATFIHVSDLHIGDDSATVDQLAGRLLRLQNILARYGIRVPLNAAEWLGTIFGHDARAVRALADFWNKERGGENRNPDVHLITTGDHAHTGSPGQFALATSLYDTWGAAFNGLEPLGLNARDWRKRAIPGNHDQWGAASFPFLLASPSPALGGMLGRTFPAVSTTAVAVGSRTLKLTFLSIDTDAGNTGLRGLPNRLLARGAFTRQLGELRGMLARKPEPDEIRILLLHHSLRIAPGHWRLAIDAWSRTQLEMFVADHEINVMLNGHVHDRAGIMKRTVAGSSGAGWEVLEACCGTTTQRVTLSSDEHAHPALALPDGPANLRIGRNMLIVHRICDDGAGAVWQAESYLLDGKFKSHRKLNPVATRAGLSESIPL